MRGHAYWSMAMSLRRTVMKGAPQHGPREAIPEEGYGPRAGAPTAVEHGHRAAAQTGSIGCLRLRARMPCAARKPWRGSYAIWRGVAHARHRLQVAANADGQSCGNITARPCLTSHDRPPPTQAASGQPHPCLRDPPKRACLTMILTMPWQSVNLTRAGLPRVTRGCGSREMSRAKHTFQVFICADYFADSYPRAHWRWGGVFTRGHMFALLSSLLPSPASAFGFGVPGFGCRVSGVGLQVSGSKGRGRWVLRAPSARLRPALRPRRAAARTCRPRSRRRCRGDGSRRRRRRRGYERVASWGVAGKNEPPRARGEWPRAGGWSRAGHAKLQQPPRTKS